MKDKSLLGFWLCVTILAAACIIVVCGDSEHGHAKRKMSEKCDPYQECTQCSIDCTTWKIKRLQSR